MLNEFKNVFSYAEGTEEMGGKHTVIDRLRVKYKNKSQIKIKEYCDSNTNFIQNRLE